MDPINDALFGSITQQHKAPSHRPASSPDPPMGASGALDPYVHGIIPAQVNRAYILDPTPPTRAEVLAPRLDTPDQLADRPDQLPPAPGPRPAPEPGPAPAPPPTSPPGDQPIGYRNETETGQVGRSGRQVGLVGRSGRQVW